MGPVDPTTLPPLPLPPGITSRFIDCTPHSLIFHILEAGSPTSPLILLVHGFPELAYSWRHVIPLLSSSYHVVALDQRGYGRTHAPDITPLPASSFRPLNLIRDVVCLTFALGYDTVQCIAGHDFGAVTAALCALSRPDIFRSCVLLSHPYQGPPSLPFHRANAKSSNRQAHSSQPESITDALANLTPPRKHYKYYYTTPSAIPDLSQPTGPALHAFLRGYFHLKSADWPGNSPQPLASWTAAALSKMPGYYIMPLHQSMRETVAESVSQSPPEEVALGQRWLSDAELAVYVAEYARTTFQGGLQWYHIQIDPDVSGDVEVWSGKKIEVPTMFIAGDKDWGTYQEPGAVEAMQNGQSVQEGMYQGTKLIEGAGHWVNQEQPQRVAELILGMAERVRGHK